MDNGYQILGRGLRQTAGDIDQFAAKMDKGQELRMLMDKMVQDRAQAIQAQRKSELDNQAMEFENTAKMDQYKRQQDFMNKWRLQQAKGQADGGQPSPTPVGPDMSVPGMPQAPGFGPSGMPPGGGPAPTQGMPPGPSSQGQAGGFDPSQFANELFANDFLSGKDYLSFQSQYARATGKNQDPEMMQLKKVTEKAKADALAALTRLRNRSKGSGQGGGGRNTNQDVLAQVLAADAAELESAESALNQLYSQAPGKWDEELPAWQAQTSQLKAQMAQALARIAKNSLLANSPETLKNAGTPTGKPGATKKKYKYIPGQGVVPK